MHSRFLDDQYYRPSDPEMRLIAKSPGSLAQMRHKGTGPIYHKLCNRILYRGSDLNSYIEKRRIEPVNN